MTEPTTPIMPGGAVAADPEPTLTEEQERLRFQETMRAARANEPPDPAKWGIQAPDWMAPSLAGRTEQLTADPDPRRRWRNWLKAQAKNPHRLRFPLPGADDPIFIQQITLEIREELSLTRIPVRLLSKGDENADLSNAKRAALDEHFKAAAVALVCYQGETGDERCFDSDDLPAIKQLGIGLIDEIVGIAEGLTAGQSFVRLDTLRPFFDSFLAWSRGFVAQPNITKGSLPGLKRSLTELMLAALPFSTQGRPSLPRE